MGHFLISSHSSIILQMFITSISASSICSTCISGISSASTSSSNEALCLRKGVGNKLFRPSQAVFTQNRSR